MTELPTDATGLWGYMSAEDVSFLRWAAQVPGIPGSILNVGCYKGLSCSVLATVGRAPVVCVDPFDGKVPDYSPSFVPATREEWEANMASCGIRDRILFFQGYSGEVLPALQRRGMRFKLALIDGSHTYADALSDIGYARLMLNPGGILVVDDAMGFPDVTRALEASGEQWRKAGSKMAWTSVEPRKL